MALNIATLTATLKGTSAGFSKTLKDAERNVNRFASQMSRVGSEIAKVGAVMGVPLALFGKQAAKSAMDVDRTLSQMGLAFGNAAPEVVKFADDLAGSMGKSKQETRAAAVTLQQFLGPIMGSKETAKGMTEELLKLAVSLSKISGQSLDETSGALQDLLEGKTKKLESLGVHIDDVTLKTIALSRGFGGEVSALSDAAKAQVYYEAALSRSASIHEAAKSASGGLSGTLDRLRANTENLTAGIGNALTPAISAMADLVNRVITYLGNLDESTIQTALKFALFVVAITGVSAAISAAAAIFGPFVTILLTVARVGVAMALPFLKFVAILGGIILIVGAFKKAWDNNLGGVQDKTRAVVSFVAEAWSSVVSFLKGLLEGLVQAWYALNAAITKIIGSIQSAWYKMVAGATDLLIGLLEKARTLVAKLPGGDELKAKIDAAIQGFQDKAGKFRDAQEEESKAIDEFTAKQIEAFLANAVDADKMLSDLKASLGKAFDGATGAIKEGALQGWADIKDTFAEGLGAVGDGIKNLIGEETFNKVLGAAEGASDFLDKIKGEIDKLTKTGKVGVNTKVPQAAMNAGAKQADRLQKDTSAYFTSIFQTVKGKIGGIAGQVMGHIEAIFQAFQTSGGDPMAAAVIAATDLLLSTEQGQAIAEILNSVLGIVINVLGSVLAPFVTLVAVVGRVVEIVVRILQPALNLLGYVLEPVIILLMIVAKFLEGLAPVLEVVALLIGVNMILTLIPLIEALKILAPAIALFFAGVLWVIKMIAIGYNTIVQVVQGAIRAIGDLVYTYINKAAGNAIRGFADTVGQASVDIGRIESAANDLKHQTNEQIMAEAKATEQHYRNAKAVKEVNEALTNMPEGYKIALARFDAASAALFGMANKSQDEQRADQARSSAAAAAMAYNSGKHAAGGIVTRPTFGLIGEAGPEAIVPLSRYNGMNGGGGGGGGMVINIDTINATDPRDFLAKLDKEISRRSVMRTGREFPGAPRSLVPHPSR